MAKKQMAGPTDVAAAFINGGKLVAIDSRGMPWTFESAGGDDAPAGAEQAFMTNGRLHVLTGGKVWTYYPGTDGWVEGFELDDKAEEGDEMEGAPWLKGRSIESRAAVPDELRRAKATVEAAEQASEAEGGKSGGRKKSKEHA